MKQNQLRMKDSNSLRFLIIFLSIVIAIICIVNTFCVLCLSCPSLVNTIFPNLKHEISVESSSIEATLLSTGLSIIGIVIAIWSGLHIIQVLGKNKYEILESEVLQYANERKRLSYFTLLKNINLLDDELNRYLYGRLSNLDLSYINTELLFQLSQIEIEFQIIYSSHYSNTLNNVNYGTSIITSLDECHDYTKDLSNKTKLIIEEYITLRQAEIYFYLGYCNYKFFFRALELYLKCFPQYKKPQNLDVIVTDPDTSPLVAYLLNTLGEACSSIIFHINKQEELSDYEKKNKSKYKYLANEYYKSLSQLLLKNQGDSKICRDVYYRNHGCALERINKKTHLSDKNIFNEIVEKYQKAIDTSFHNISDKNFKVWLSLYKKYTDYQLGITKNNKEIKQFELDDIEYDYMYNYSKQAEALSEIALSKCLDKIQMLKYMMFVYRTMCWLAKVTNNTELYNRYFSLFSEKFDLLNELCNSDKLKDDFYKELLLQYEQLSN